MAYRNNAGRLALGTAQLGMPYGISNRVGKPAFQQASEILRVALSAGVVDIDTAQGYGDSETIIGVALASIVLEKQPKIITKGFALTNGQCTLRRSVEASLRLLTVERLEAWLLHDEQELAHWTEDVVREMNALRNENSVAAFGISIYNPASISKALRVYPLSVVQCPASPFDRRFLRYDFSVLPACEQPFRFYFRSIYLQGLCLMDIDDVPRTIPYAKEAVSNLIRFCKKNDISRDEFCMKYVLNRSAHVGAKVVIGVESIVQLQRNLQILATPDPSPDLFSEWDELWPDDLERLICPQLWNP